MAVNRRQIEDGAVSPSKLLAAIKERRYWFERFGSQPSLSTSNGYSDPTGATGAINRAFFHGGVSGYHVKGAGQTLLGPSTNVSTGGLDVSQDQTAAEGAEHLFGAQAGLMNPFAAVIGTSKDLFVKLKFALSAGAGGAGSEAAVGIRKVEAFQANFDDYDELAALNILNGNVTRETILNAAATVSIDTGLDAADGVDITLEVRMQGRRARFYVNNVEYATGAQFLFDAGENVVPFFFFLQGATPVTCTWKELEIGYVQDVDPYGA